MYRVAKFARTKGVVHRLGIGVVCKEGLGGRLRSSRTKTTKMLVYS